MPILRTKGKGNCEVCGRFSYAIQIDPPDYFGEGCDVWGEWCKKHIPQWAKQAMKRYEAEQEAIAKGREVMSDESDLPKSPEYIDAFLEAVYPGNVALVKSFFSEKKALIDATILINDLHTQLAACQERLEKAEGLLKGVVNKPFYSRGWVDRVLEIQTFLSTTAPSDLVVVRRDYLLQLWRLWQVEGRHYKQFQEIDDFLTEKLV